jgi:hypothetical protein
MSKSHANHPSRFGQTLGGPNAAALPVAFPPGHVGPVALPGTGRMVWWTGKVAIGLLSQNAKRFESALWLQDLLLAGRQPVNSAA